MKIKIKAFLIKVLLVFFMCDNAVFRTYELGVLGGGGVGVGQGSL